MSWLSKENAEWLVGQWLRLRGNRMARYAGYLIIATVAAVSNLTQVIVAAALRLFGVTISFPNTSAATIAAILMAAFLMLLFDRLIPERVPQAPPANPHDAQLLREIRNLFNAEAQHFLRDHNFENKFERRELERFDRVGHTWRGAQYEFVDPEMQTCWAELRSKVLAFLLVTSLNTWVDDYNMEMQTPYPDRYNDFNLPPHVLENIKKMNDAGDEVVQAFDALERLGRIRMPSV